MLSEAIQTQLRAELVLLEGRRREIESVEAAIQMLLDRETPDETPSEDADPEPVETPEPTTPVKKKNRGGRPSRYDWKKGRQVWDGSHPSRTKNQTYDAIAAVLGCTPQGVKSRASVHEWGPHGTKYKGKGGANLPYLDTRTTRP